MRYWTGTTGIGIYEESLLEQENEEEELDLAPDLRTT